MPNRVLVELRVGPDLIERTRRRANDRWVVCEASAGRREPVLKGTDVSVRSGQVDGGQAVSFSARSWANAGVDACAGPHERYLHNGIESIAIRLPAEAILPMVAAQRHVIDAAGHVQSRLAKHPCLPELRDPAGMMIATVAAWQPAFLARIRRNAILQTRFASAQGPLSATSSRGVKTP